jgi:hypothetical protein
MFSHLTYRLQADVETVQKVLVTNNALRELLIAKNAVLTRGPIAAPAGIDDIVQTVHDLAGLISNAPNKLDWQIYDHCAALTRLYAAYEQYVGELVGEYVRLLPRLYVKYSELPASITTQHRVGVGHILLKIGEKGPYKNLEEQVIVRELAAGLSGASEYTLLADAFFIDRQNLRLEMLCRLFSALGFSHCARSINRHPHVIAFIRAERADSSSAEKELSDFIEYRNEAAHRKVENVLAIDTIGSIGRFIVAVATALAQMVEEGVLKRRMELNHYSSVLNISEVHYDGHVVIGTPIANVSIAVGDELILFGKNVCHRVKLESMQLNGEPVQNTTGDGATEIGLRLDRQAKIGAELRRLDIPSEVPLEVQLDLQESMPAMADQADSDIAEVVPQAQEQGIPEAVNQGDESDPGTSDDVSRP